MISLGHQAIGAASSLLPATISRAAEFFAGALARPPLGASPIIIQQMLSLISDQTSSSSLPTIAVQEGPLSITASESGEVHRPRNLEVPYGDPGVSRKLKSREDRSSETTMINL